VRLHFARYMDCFIKLVDSRCMILISLAVVMSGCSFVSSQILDAGNYIAKKVGLVSEDSSYSQDKQRENALEIITPEEEYYIGRAVAARILQRFPSATDPNLQKYVQLIGQALVISDGAGAPFGGYHFRVIESNQLNAISAPGGYVFITTRFLRSLESEDQLAAILAHEVAHISMRHGLKTLKDTSLLAEVSGLGLASSGLSCIEALAQATVIFSHLVDGLVDTLLESGYSQEYEYQADQGSYERLFKSGYQPQAIFNALKVIENSEEAAKNAGGWFGTHPSVAERVAKLKSFETLTSRDLSETGLNIRLQRWEQFLKGL